MFSYKLTYKNGQITGESIQSLISYVQKHIDENCQTFDDIPDCIEQFNEMNPDSLVEVEIHVKLNK